MALTVMCFVGLSTFPRWRQEVNAATGSLGRRSKHVHSSLCIGISSYANRGFVATRRGSLCSGNDRSCSAGLCCWACGHSSGSLGVGELHHECNGHCKPMR
jgi:hypothetical protein